MLELSLYNYFVTLETKLLFPGSEALRVGAKLPEEGPGYQELGDGCLDQVGIDKPI